MVPCSLVLEAWLFVVSCEFCLCARDRFVGLCMVCVLVCAVSFSVVFLLNNLEIYGKHWRHNLRLLYIVERARKMKQKLSRFFEHLTHHSSI